MKSQIKTVTKVAGKIYKVELENFDEKMKLLEI